MASDVEVVQRMTDRALLGKDSHIEAIRILDGLDWKLAGARPRGVPHSVFQLVNHMIYWQEWAVKWLDGKRPRAPKHAAGSWPGCVGPANRKEWQQTARRLRAALDALARLARQGDLLSRRGQWTRLEMLHIIGSHTSYHAGQVALVRQLLASWPPPSGGVTW